jgi:signal transduction histidine kinase/CheY-like chemotaxis protein/HAMP domain-containing protein
MTDVDHERPRLDRAALEQLLAGLTAVRGGDFSTRLAPTGDPLVDEIATVFNRMVDQLDQFTSEVTRVAREVGTDGKLGGQANVPGVSGTWKDLTESVNAMAGNLTWQVRNIAQVATAVAKGDLTQKIDVTAQGEILELKTTLNTMVDQLSSFAAEVTRVAREVGRDGKLGGQAEVEGVSGTWKRLTENVNELAGTLTRQIRAISTVTSAVAAGDLTRTISVEAAGEVAELKDSINAMVRSLRDTVQASVDQDWLKTNLASIGSMLQGHRDLEVVAELIMEELAPLLGAQHGTFFLAGEWDDETRLRLIAGYGLRADKDAPIQYRIGQSLIGQVAKSKRPVVVEDIPQGYIRISSGLGDAPPANLAIMPILFEDQVLGVVELASFTKFTPIQLAFLEQLAETLGVSVNAIIANSRTDALLEESQRLTAELQVRSGELTARSEELQRSNADLEDKAALLAAQKRDIEAKNDEIELAREEIEARARQLALASQYKSQFLANMSHELRTPLNSLLILARLLAQNPGGNLTGKQVEYANVIHSAGSDLLQLINDILDLSKVEAGRMDVRAERFALATLVEDIQATFQPLTAEKGLDFDVLVDQSAPLEIVSDRQRLRQVLGNLLSNAVKFTERGRVTLRVTGGPAAGTAGAGPSVSFSVTDTGIGIAPENLAVIFGAFQQGDGTLSRRYGGTGLGLSIANEVSALLGGRISPSSDLGRGSTFTLSVPATLPEVQPSIPAPDAAFAGSDGIAALEGRPGLDELTDRPGPGGADRLDARNSWYGAGAPPVLAPEPGREAGPALPPGVVPGAGLAPARPGHEPGWSNASAGDRNVMVFEPEGGGLLTLLAHSAVSDLTEVSAAVRVRTATSPGQGTTMLAAEPYRCVVVDLATPTAAEFLDQVQGKPELREIPVLAHAPGQAARPQGRLAALRSGFPSLELLASLDDLRERITLHLSAEQPGLVPAHPDDASLAGDTRLAGDTGRFDDGVFDGSAFIGDHGIRGLGRPLTALADHPGLRGKRVLVIDDDARNVYAITSTLELHGLRVTQASDGRQGIEALRAAPETDLILMDVMMPGMDGYATMAAIRQMPQFGRLPIIAVTARAMPGDREKSLAAGATDYVTKPVDTDELLARMERWLSQG